MANNYYRFHSNGFLATLSAVPRIFQNAILNDDWTQDGGRYIFPQLIFGEYPETLQFPLEFITRDGKKINNIIETRYPGCFLISEHLKRIFENEGLTGWKTYDIEIHRINGEVLPGFYGFSVIGRNQIIDNGTAVDVPDFFELRPDWGAIICSQKVVDVLKGYKIRDFDTTLVCAGDPYYDQINFPK